MITNNDKLILEAYVRTINEAIDPNMSLDDYVKKIGQSISSLKGYKQTAKTLMTLINVGNLANKGINAFSDDADVSGGGDADASGADSDVIDKGGYEVDKDGNGTGASASADDDAAGVGDDGSETLNKFIKQNPSMAQFGDTGPYIEDALKDNWKSLGIEGSYEDYMHKAKPEEMMKTLSKILHNPNSIGHDDLAEEFKELYDDGKLTPEMMTKAGINFKDIGFDNNLGLESNPVSSSSDVYKNKEWFKMFAQKEDLGLKNGSAELHGYEPSDAINKIADTLTDKYKPSDLLKIYKQPGGIGKLLELAKNMK